LKFLLKFLKRNAKFSKPQIWGRKVQKKEKKKPLVTGPYFFHQLAHKENAAWMEDQNFRSHLKKKLLMKIENLFARYL